ncbi:catalytic/ hydrolase isoform X4 [Iris pallida]|uniref:Catalytic/ hydrolase isoform X4 n=1 Tax=Iris pallida TaxID=29817 RepID=A0AAX6DL42_IRIPA|nr:catalytic/ hydrolase isoform X4 [Iris pallida]
MPYCEISESDTKIFYRTYGHGSTKVLLIIGLAATHEAWGPQIKGLARTAEPNDDEEEGSPADGGPMPDGCDEEGQATGGVEVCCFDNRGIGRSSIPTKKSDYTTTIMAKDALALLDHLGWRKAHVFGHSMGSMIAYKLAAIAPDRLLSLALLNATGGGFECFPRIDSQMISLAFRFLRAKTPEQRAAVDLETHYTPEYLDECVGSSTRRKILHQEYVKAISSTGMQSSSGFEGQINACWTHKMTLKELDKIRASGFLISVIHGRHDVIAQLCHAKRLAEKLQPAARMVELHGGHLVTHERPDEVNQALTDLIKASNSRIDPEYWSNMNETTSGACVIGFEHMKNIIRKPARVADYDSHGLHLRYDSGST